MSFGHEKYSDLLFWKAKSHIVFNVVFVQLIFFRAMYLISNPEVNKGE